MNSRQKDMVCKERSANRDAYIAPKLKVFGPVGSLTQAGSTQGNETAPGGPMSMA
jgi:hypothetical protein